MSTAPQVASNPSTSSQSGWLVAVFVGSVITLLGGGLLGAAGAVGSVTSRTDDGLLMRDEYPPFRLDQGPAELEVTAEASTETTAL